MTGPLESTKFYLLLALAEGPLRGASVRRQILEDTVGMYLADGTLYESLASLVRTGLLERTDTTYRLTDKGRRRLELEARTLGRAVELSRARLGWR